MSGYLEFRTCSNILPFLKMIFLNGADVNTGRAYEVPSGYLSIIGFGSCGSDIAETEILGN